MKIVHCLFASCTLLKLLRSLIVWFMFSSVVLGGEYNYHFQYLTINDGLPQNTVNAVLRDSQGFMWFGTGNGLCRYDGYVFRNLNKADLPCHFINALAQTPDQRVWIGTSMGLCYFNLITEKIVPFSSLVKDHRAISIVSLYSDQDGDLWVGTASDGVFMLKKRGADYDVLHLDSKTSTLPGNQVLSLLQMRDGRIFIGTNHGIAVYNKQQQSLYKFSSGNLQNSQVISLFESREGDLWVGTQMGLWVYNLQTSRERFYINNPFEKGSISHNRINCVTQDFKGNIYVGTLGGLDIYRPHTDDFDHVRSSGNGNYSLNSIFVKCLLVDNQGNVWIGTEKGGVNQFNLFQKPFNHLVYQIDDANSLSSNTINAVIAEGNVWWIGTAGGGLNRYDKLTGKVDHFKNNPANSNSIASDYISSLYQTSDGVLWISTWGMGLCKMLPNGTFKRLSPPVNSGDNNFHNTFVSSLEYDKRGYLLVGTEGGLALLNLKTEEFVELDVNQNGLSRIAEIGCILADSHGFIWIGTRLGLYRIPAQSLNISDKVRCAPDQIQFFSSNVDQKKDNDLPGNYVISFLEDQQGNVWVGTYGDGFAKCVIDDKGAVSFVHYSQKDGLCNDVVYAMQQDESGYLWLSTDFGLSRLDPKTMRFDNYFTDDGLLSEQFYWSASYKNREGQLFFGGINGLNYFHPASFPVYPYQPEVTITSVNIYNQPLTVGEERFGEVVFPSALSVSDTINLSHRDNVFSIDFSALDYFHSSKIKYAYQLEGVDRAWVEVPASQRVATYSNLKGGTYHFRVKACNSDGQWNEHVRMMTIVIRPPFWQTTWFQIFVLLLIVVAAFGYLRYHTRRLLIQKMKLETMVHDRTKTIEEQNDQMRQQANDLKRANAVLETRQELIEGQKRELELMNGEVVLQRDQVVELNKQIEQINQVRMTFFTNISHEFRTPLTLIMAPIERLLKEVHLPGAVNDILVGVQRNAQRLNLLVDQLLTFRKIETGNLKVMLCHDDVGAFITDLFHAFDVLAVPRKINYQLNVNIDSSKRWFDREKMENILYNLLANAFKYTPEEGSVSLNVMLESGKRGASGSPTLRIEVSDTGMGIDAKDIDQIFDRFYRTPQGSVIKGTGIGLALTRELVEAMNGAIMVTSRLGRGSSFVVTLPCQKEDFTNAEVSEIETYDKSDLDAKVQVVVDHLAEEEEFLEEVQSSESDEPTILVVEDNRELATFLAGALSDEYRVVTAENGKIGYDLARKYSPELIISDVMMPVMDGIEMCRQLKNNLYTSHIPIVMLSAKAMIENQLEGLQTGADDYISKPFNLDVLRAKVKNQIEVRQRMRNMFATQAVPQPSETTTSAVDEKFLVKAYEILETGFSNPDFNVELFSDLMFVSRSLLYKKLKALVDLSPNDFITVFRLKKSLPLLVTERLSINEVAYRIGFNDPKYFSRVFKKYYKKTPSEYVG